MHFSKVLWCFVVGEKLKRGEFGIKSCLNVFEKFERVWKEIADGNEGEVVRVWWEVVRIRRKVARKSSNFIFSSQTPSKYQAT
jgi:hypothetical protein